MVVKLLSMKTFALLVLLCVLAGCNATELPPTVMSLEGRATEIVLTENAPPEGFSTVSFPQISANLTALAGWRYEAVMEFDGVFARTTRPARARTTAIVYYNQIASARRVVASIANDLQANAAPIEYEAVRLGPDAFLVRDGVCLSNAGEDAFTVADLSAGTLIGGVQAAETAAQIATINGEQVWRYNFALDDMLLPSIGLGDSSQILEMRGELWIAPEHNAVVRYHANLEVENVFVFDSALPVTGTVILRYDLYNVGEVPNLSVPFGC